MTEVPRKITRQEVVKLLRETDPELQITGRLFLRKAGRLCMCAEGVIAAEMVARWPEVFSISDGEAGLPALCWEGNVERSLLWDNLKERFLEAGLTYRFVYLNDKEGLTFAEIADHLEANLND